MFSSRRLRASAESELISKSKNTVFSSVTSSHSSATETVTVQVSVPKAFVAVIVMV